MKFKLLFALIALSIVSCSKDDDSDTKDSNPAAQGKKLDKITDTRFKTDGSVNTTTIAEFTDSKLVSQSTYQLDQMVANSTYMYNESGLLVEKKSYDSSISGGAQPYASSLFKYDGQGRVTEHDYNYVIIEADRTITTYTYNSDTTISASADYFDVLNNEHIITNDKYYVNTNGHVYKKTGSDGSNKLMAVYQGENLTSYVSGLNTISFEYNTTDVPKGQYHNIVQNLYGGNLLSAVLVNGFDAIDFGVKNYVTKETTAGVSATSYLIYTYEFDSEGYPVKVKCYKDGNSLPYLIREIQYEL